MVKPPLRTKSIGFKVSEEEYAQLETAARASGRTLGRVAKPLNFGVAHPLRFSFLQRVRAFDFPSA